MNIVVNLPEEELHQKGQNAFDYAIEHFSKRENLGKLISIINEIIPV